MAFVLPIATTGCSCSLNLLMARWLYREGLAEAPKTNVFFDIGDMFK
jgi:hypothetical protein